METITHRVRRCNGNRAAWCLVALDEDGNERISYGSSVTAMSIDDLVRRAGDMLSSASVIQLVFDEEA